jgi:hypothetical protein
MSGSDAAKKIGDTFFQLLIFPPIGALSPRRALVASLARNKPGEIGKSNNHGDLVRSAVRKDRFVKHADRTQMRCEAYGRVHDAAAHQNRSLVRARSLPEPRRRQTSFGGYL